LKNGLDYLSVDASTPLVVFGEIHTYRHWKNYLKKSRKIRKIQQQLGVPAILLVDAGTTFRKVSNGDQTVLVAPAPLWLPHLP
jgi:hypothetical protein